MEEIKIASIDEIDKLLDFYNLIIFQQQFDSYTPMWTKDIYPCRCDIENHIKNNKFYYLEDNDEIICALAFQIGEEEMYKGANFKINENIGVFHLLAANPKYRKLGKAKKIINYVIEDNKDKVKAIHLDVMLNNLSAAKLYESLGFNFIKRKLVFYKDTGKCYADLYELVL